MPPKRRKTAVDILDKVLDTASLPHSIDIASLKQQIEEQLRVLNVRAPVKQLGKGDSVESRKLVLLEQILKTDVPLKTQRLASAVGMKAKDFETLSFKVAQYSNAPSTRSSKKRSRSSSSSQKSRNNVNNTNNNAATSTIPALSIRLGSQVHDSHGFARRAQQLLKDMEQYISSTLTISTQKKRGYLQDMQRSRAAYEAACFYLVARGKKMKKATTRSSDDALQGEEEDTQLSIQDILDASNSVSASEFRGILPTVEKFADDMEDGGKKVAASSKQDAGGPVKRKRGKPRKGSEQQRNSTVDGVARALLEGVEDAAASNDTKRQRVSSIAETTPTFVYSPKFLEWKKRVLQETCDRTKQLMSEEQGDDMASISDSDAMQRAADEILRRSGLLD